MRTRDVIFLSAGGLLLLLIAVFAVRIVSLQDSPRVELGRVKMLQLDPETREVLSSLQQDVLVTYYVSSRTTMPSSMRRLERDVVDLLSTMKRSAGERFDFQIIDPQAQPELLRHASHQRVSPFRVRSIARDSYTEQTVWSTLHIAYGAHEPAIINGVSPEHLPRLQSLIVGQLRQKDSPRRAAFGLIAGPAYTQLEPYLAQYGRVVRLDPVAGSITEDVDLLFWMDPGAVTPAMIRSLLQFLASGRSVVIAGSVHSVDMLPRDADAIPRFELTPSGFDAETLFSAFGLRAVDGLVLDDFSQAIPAKPAPMPAKFLIRCSAPNQDFRQMRSLPNGNLLFAAPTPLSLDRETLAHQGWIPTVLATTSDRTELAETVRGEVRLDSASVQHGDPVPKLPLMVWLRPNEAWRGSLVVAASSSPFRDGSFLADGFAHRRLVEVLCNTLASDERLVIHQAGIERATPLPELGPSARAGWRVFCIALVPMILAVAAWRRGILASAGAARTSQTRSVLTSLPLQGIMGLLVVMLVAAGALVMGIRLDLTASQLNRVSPSTRAIVAEHGRGEIEARLIVSRTELLPPELRPLVRRLRSELRELERAGARLAVAWTPPEDMAQEERSALEQRGVRAIRMTTRDEDITTVRSVYMTLELSSNGRRELLTFSDRASFENVEFRLAFALWRLETGRKPHIAFASDVPRLSAAEAFHDFQQRNLLAPSGADVYSLAREALERMDFRVTHVNPRSPELPEDIDLIIWMQPRRNILPMLDETVRRLHRGVPVMIAAQHFNMQSRQYRGAGFKMVYWPQPQVADVHLTYFPDLGIELVHEVLFDELKLALPLETQVNRDAEHRDYEEQTSALPFLIRAVAANFDRTTSIMRGVGDQAFPFPSYVRVDTDRLAAANIAATPIIFTSDRSWSYNWTGGWIPDELLQGPPTEATADAKLLGRVPLAVLFEGAFPKPSASLITRRAEAAGAVEFDPTPGVPTKLVFVGCSQMFKNERLLDPEYRADHLLMNIAASLGLDDNLARIASHRRIAPGFDYIEPDLRLRWRAIVLAAGPVVMLAFGMFWNVWRRRAPALFVKETAI
ncbi:MAG TPA: Gldg family protein [Phycisphaerales bacterium]|nr:Gldg family protein [Phycisphaerales bacterium]